MTLREVMAWDVGAGWRERRVPLDRQTSIPRCSLSNVDLASPSVLGASVALVGFGLGCWSVATPARASCDGPRLPTNPHPVASEIVICGTLAYPLRARELFDAY
eukprot:12591337-Alexandrium_andersonii.AAC.1